MHAHCMHLISTSLPSTGPSQGLGIRQREPRGCTTAIVNNTQCRQSSTPYVAACMKGAAKATRQSPKGQRPRPFKPHAESARLLNISSQINAIVAIPAPLISETSIVRWGVPTTRKSDKFIYERVYIYIPPRKEERIYVRCMR